MGIGTKISLHSDGSLQYQELFPSRGYLSSSEPLIHFCLGTASKLDSLTLEWPDGGKQIVYDVVPNETITVEIGKDFSSTGSIDT